MYHTVEEGDVFWCFRVFGLWIMALRRVWYPTIGSKNRFSANHVIRRQTNLRYCSNRAERNISVYSRSKASFPELSELIKMIYAFSSKS